MREITIDDARLQPFAATDSIDREAQMLIQFTKAILALPTLRLYSALRTLNIKFTRCSDDANDLQFRILNTILKCTMGQWTQNLHENWQDLWVGRFEDRIFHHSALGDFMSSVHRQELTVMLLPFSPSGRLSHLSSLTIANLSEDTNDLLYDNSPAFLSFANSESLSELKLMVTTRQDPAHPSEQIFLLEKYEFFEKLPTTWLSPAICFNLRILSLYCRDYFGWAPKLDFRMLNPGNNINSALPNLRVLALGKFVFSHNWQVEWIASLGAQNGRGGLEELYLDDCPIMWRAHVLGPMDRSTSVVNGVHIDNSGFPLKKVMTRQSPHNERWDTVMVQYRLRWSTVLQTWRSKMTALKAFTMGSGDWEDEHATTVATARTRDLDGDPESMMASRPAWKQRCADMMHCNFDKPSLAECLQHDDSNSSIQEGLGLNQSRESILQYIHFHVGLGWVERDFKEYLMAQYEDGWQRYEASRRADEKAFRDLQDTIATKT